MKTIYLDNAATSWPKPPAVEKAMRTFNNEIGANPGRSAHHRSIDSARILFNTREKMARLIEAEDPLRIIFTKNATEALNIASIGLLQKGDRVLISALEHNAVMRPLRFLESRGISVVIVPSNEYGEIDPDDLRKSLSVKTRAFYCLHSSNVTGTIMPVETFGEIARSFGALFVLDASQTCGAYPVSVMKTNADLLAFTGHKSLLGPQGTGGLYIRNGLESEISPILFGGTGSRSESEIQPDFMPDKFESGTPNAIGIAGLSAALDFIINEGVESVHKRESTLAALLTDGLSSIHEITIYHKSGKPRMPVVSFTIKGKSSSDVAHILDDTYGICTRPGLHCAPSAHKTIGTFPDGTVRLSIGPFTTKDEILFTVSCIEKITSVQ